MNNFLDLQSAQMHAILNRSDICSDITTGTFTLNSSVIYPSFLIPYFSRTSFTCGPCVYYYIVIVYFGVIYWWKYIISLCITGVFCTHWKNWHVLSTRVRGRLTFWHCIACCVNSIPRENWLRKELSQVCYRELVTFQLDLRLLKQWDEAIIILD